MAVSACPDRALKSSYWPTLISDLFVQSLTQLFLTLHILRSQLIQLMGQGCLLEGQPDLGHQLTAISRPVIVNAFHAFLQVLEVHPPVFMIWLKVKKNKAAKVHVLSTWLPIQFQKKYKIYTIHNNITWGHTNLFEKITPSATESSNHMQIRKEASQ